jgi:serine protease Do
VKGATPSVASITASRVVQMPRQLPFPFSFGPGFRDFFDSPGPGAPEGEGPSQRQQGLGSGVVVTQDGYLLTNHHVIDGASEIEVTLADDRKFDAKVVGSDPGTDIAVLKIEAKSLPALPFGNSSNVRIGDIVFAIGNPFGVGQTVTMGIVGATGRGGLNIENYEDFIQTDAAINPGNSGGALIDISGKVIGINTAIVTGAGRGNQGVGFAVPINMVHGVMKQIIETGKVTRGYLGVTIQDVEPATAKAFGAPDTSGALINGVEPGSPAAKAGLKQGDVIRKVNGEPVRDVRNLRLAIAAMKPGTTVNLGVWRDGAEKPMQIQLEELQTEQKTAESRSEPGSGLGNVEVEDLTAGIARQLGLPPQTRGVVVSNVGPGSAAYEAGLRRGDVIQEVARTPVTSVAEYRNAIAKAGSGPILLLVNRQGRTVYLVIEQR